MNDRRLPAVQKWPFFVADLLLLSLAFWLVAHYPHPIPTWAAVLVTGCVVVAAVLATLPYRLEYQALSRVAEGDGLSNAVTQIQNMETVAETIRLATSQWQGVQEHSARTVSAAKEIGDRLSVEAHNFGEFMQKANDSEKGTLRLEVEKLRRSEGEWLQVLVHLLDHVFALHQAGARSGQPNLATQLGQFQVACREIVRRIGLQAFEAVPNEPFDEARHQVVEGQPTATSDGVISQVLATGYTYQGQLLRRALVEVSCNPQQESAAPGASSFDPASTTAADSEGSTVGADPTAETRREGGIALAPPAELSVTEDGMAGLAGVEAAAALEAGAVATGEPGPGPEDGTEVVELSQFIRSAATAEPGAGDAGAARQPAGAGVESVEFTLTTRVDSAGGFQIEAAPAEDAGADHFAAGAAAGAQPSAHSEGPVARGAGQQELLNQQEEPQELFRLEPKVVPKGRQNSKRA